MNQEIFKDRYLYPLTEPDQQGKQRKLGIECNIFKNSDDCEQLVFKYAFGQGESLYFPAPQMIFQDIINSIRDVLKSKEPGSSPVVEAQPNPNKPAVKIAVGRDDTLRPFIAIQGDINGKGRSKRFYWYMPKGYTMSRNGSPISDLEQQERMARAFCDRAQLFLKDLEERYKARVFNPGGNRGSGGGNNNYRAPAGDANFDDMF